MAGNSSHLWRRWPGLLFGLFLLLFLLPDTALGWDYNLFSTFDYRFSDSTTRNTVTGQTNDRDSHFFRQLYNLNLRHSFFPNLILQGGGTFEDATNKSIQDSDTSTFDSQALRPFGSLRLNNPLYHAGVDYQESWRQSEAENVSKQEIIRRELSVGGGMTPIGLPDFSLRYSRTHLNNIPKTQENQEEQYRFNTSYNYRGLAMRYSYNRSELENQITGSTIMRQNHTGRMEYGRNYLKRLDLSGSYGFGYTTSTFQGPRPEPFPLNALFGLFAVSDFPTEGALELLTALNDGNADASSGINLGVNGDARNVLNVGLDFGLILPVDKLLIWVDRRVEQQVVSGLSWTVFISDRNDESAQWTAVTGAITAPFSDFFNRFEISIPRVETRFIKVVVSPLSPVNPAADSFQDLFVTEIQGLTVLPAGKRKNESLAQDLVLGLRYKVSEETGVGYSFSYRQADAILIDRSSYYLSNGFFLNHRFSKMLKGALSGSRIDNWGSGQEKGTTYTYSASLRGDWSKVFSQSLLFNGSEASGIYDGSTQSVVLRNQLRPYRGWTLNLDGGRSWSENSTNSLVRIATGIRPNDKVSFSLNYSGTFVENKDEGVTDRESRHDYSGQIFFSPVKTLSLTAGIRINERGGESRVLQSYGVNWSPLLGGALQFSTSYNEFIASTTDQETRQFSSAVHWKISRHLSGSLAYSKINNSSSTQVTNSQNILSSVTIIF